MALSFVRNETTFGTCPLCHKGNNSTRLVVSKKYGQRCCSDCRAGKSIIICARCAADARIAGSGVRGPVCFACYKRFDQPKQQCFCCGEVQILKDTSRRLCKKCLTKKNVVCITCEKVRPDAGHGMCGPCSRRRLRHQSTA